MEPEAGHDRDRPMGISPAGAPVRRRVAWASLALTLANSALMALLVSPGGPGVVTVLSPAPGAVVGVDGVLLIARVPMDARVDPESVRVLLNGADVTEQLVTGQNGVVGTLHGVLDGENLLRVEVEAASWWFDGRRYPSGEEVRFLARRPLDLDRG